MNRVILFCGTIVVAIAAPVDNEATAKILNFENESDGTGNYFFSFETSNGIYRSEGGTVMNEGEPDQYIYVSGYISFTDPDGKKQEFRYEADQNGYKILPPVEMTVFSSPNLVASLLG